MGHPAQELGGGGSDAPGSRGDGPDPIEGGGDRPDLDAVPHSSRPVREGQGGSRSGDHAGDVVHDDAHERGCAPEDREGDVIRPRVGQEEREAEPRSWGWARQVDVESCVLVDVEDPARVGQDQGCRSREGRSSNGGDGPETRDVDVASNASSSAGDDVDASGAAPGRVAGVDVDTGGVASSVVGGVQGSDDDAVLIGPGSGARTGGGLKNDGHGGSQREFLRPEVSGGGLLGPSQEGIPSATRSPSPCHLTRLQCRGM
ncbi:hypothetical protein CMI37_19065 [Candidatus Pacearchaeota archaeon]|nr:hypothetical protein [Candidatus Pacearchaeota archaeon]